MCSLGGENTLFHTSISTRCIALFFMIVMQRQSLKNKESVSNKTY